MPFAPATSPTWQHFAGFAFLCQCLLCTQDLKGGRSSPDAISHILHGWEYCSCYYGHWPLLQSHTVGWVVAHLQIPFCKAVFYLLSPPAHNVDTYSIPVWGCCTTICQNLRSSCQPFSPVCWCPSSVLMSLQCAHHTSPVCRQLQTCHGYTSSHHWGHWQWCHTVSAPRFQPTAGFATGSQPLSLRVQPILHQIFLSSSSYLSSVVK